MDAALAPITYTPATVSSDWKQQLPLMQSEQVTLRELRPSDAPSLLALLTTQEVARFISPPPTTLEGFERFIAWARREQTRGGYVCFAVVPAGLDTAIGIFQLRSLETGFATGEWGFAMGQMFWGTGVFADSAKLVLEFAFEVVGVHRLEARSTVANGRGNGALEKIGAIRECVLRKSFAKDSERHDQVLWAILADEWRARRTDRAILRRPN